MFNNCVFYLYWYDEQNPAGVEVNVIRALLFVFDTYEDQLRKLVGLLMFQEMIDTLNWNELFRANSTTTAVSFAGS